MRIVKYEDKQKGVHILREGERNKERIFAYIQNNATRNSGVTKTQIRVGLENEGLKLSRPTIDFHLNELMQEGRVCRTGKKYVILKSLFNDVVSFSRLMGDNSSTLMDRSVIELDSEVEPYSSIPESQSTYSYPNEGFDPLFPYVHKHPTPRDYFIKKVSGFRLSKKHQNNKSLNAKQKLIFEYASRLGAFITYIFIQALIPTDLKSPDKRELVYSLINSSINLDNLFGSFRRLLTQAGLTHLTSDELRPEFEEYNNLWELDKKRYDKLSEIFKTLYPSIYDGLEDFWYQSTMYWIKIDEDKSLTESCLHDWKRYEFFKIGTHYKCEKCRLIITELFYKNNFAYK